MPRPDEPTEPTDPIDPTEPTEPTEPAESTGPTATRPDGRYGWIPDGPDHRDWWAAPSVVRPAVGLPERVDLRADCPAVYDQGALGSCTAQAVAGAYELDRKRQGLDRLTPSTLFIYFEERVLEGTVDHDSGATLRDGMRTLDRIGTCAEPDWPYVVERFRERPPARCYVDAARHRAVAYRRVPQETSAIRACLAAGRPVVFGFSVFESFESVAVERTGVVPMPGPDERRLGGHAVVAVGYDPDAFLVRNSWGSGWGDDGYCTMPVEYVTDPGLTADLWTLEAVTAPPAS